MVVKVLNKFQVIVYLFVIFVIFFVIFVIKFMIKILRKGLYVCFNRFEEYNGMVLVFVKECSCFFFFF